MRLTRLIIKLFFIQALVLSCTEDTPVGTFNLSQEAQKYKIDSTITSFQMIDKNNITEGFYLEDYLNYYHEPWEDGLFEIYRVNYISVINNYYFEVNLRANDISSILSINWNNKTQFNYYFKTTEIYGEPKAPSLKFSDSIKIRNTMYYDIIEIDYTNSISKIKDESLIKAYVAGKKGLIKLERKDGNILERIN